MTLPMYVPEPVLLVALAARTHRHGAERGEPAVEKLRGPAETLVRSVAQPEHRVMHVLEQVARQARTQERRP
jgi:hypothetical protein